VGGAGVQQQQQQGVLGQQGGLGQQGLGQQQQQQLLPELLAPWWALYEKEGYLLSWRDGRAAVVLKEGQGVGKFGSSSNSIAGGQVLLRALWQAAWLDAHAGKHHQQQHHHQQQQQHGEHSTGLNGVGGQESLSGEQLRGQQDLVLLQKSLQAVDQQFGSFIQEAEAAGWRTDQLVLKVGPSRVQQVVSEMKGSTDSW
jgi:hypothetical protein